ncbi:hypothetical protein B0J13DRAFT_630172 [Dactylonectria estremocensis]|uniref:Uncharacterized protein n=1 Tax=Dactylonectria estremocensis TaxID=1079267 RepID=A0A9P9IDY8_9HYPO|nr:hypothetical protein B0J13DRAFT_630172 [Dactylonectria estremocensis]
MASEPGVAATPEMVNPVYQEIIDRGTPIILSSPTPTPLQPPNKRPRYDQTTPTARLDLQHSGRPHKAAYTTPSGLGASIHTRPNNIATDSLTQVLREQDRRLNATRTVLKLVANSLDNITATCDQELKAPAEEIITLFTSFLKATILKTNDSPKLCPGLLQPILCIGVQALSTDHLVARA